MKRLAACAAFALVCSALLALGPHGFTEGKIKSVDAGRHVITITVAGEDREYAVTRATRIGTDHGPVPLDLADANLPEGAPVQFKAALRRGRHVLVGLRLVVPRDHAFARVDTSGLKPLTELGKGTYKGVPGGLYPDGRNTRPAAHEAAGLALARRVRPLDAFGRPSADGSIVLLSVGMSNTSQAFSAFKQLADADADRSPNLVIVDGAQGGMSADRIADFEGTGSAAAYWQEVERRLEAAGVTRAQVQVAWVKDADPGPHSGFPAYARTLQKQLARIVQAMHEHCPNLKLVYLSSRSYAGYARTPLNPEPYAYESGFAVRWLIEQQIKGDLALNYDPDRGKVRAPWLSWGPYLWANGPHPRADGLFYRESDFAEDGTHPSAAGRRKLAGLLLHFFKTDTTTRPWFVAR